LQCKEEYPGFSIYWVYFLIIGKQQVKIPGSSGLFSNIYFIFNQWQELGHSFPLFSLGLPLFQPAVGIG
jgi:hypothetical protein